MLMSSHCGKLYRISAITMCIAIEERESLKFLDLIKFGYQFIKQPLTMDSIGELHSIQLCSMNHES